VNSDLAKAGLARETVVAAVVHLLDRTHLRIGNDEYVRANKSFGICTLLDRHVVVTSRSVRVAFTGKSGVPHERTVTSRRLARIVRGCRDLPGQELFQYRGKDGSIRSIGSIDVNDYLREVSGGEFTAKDFRTWAGTVAASAFLRNEPVPESVAAQKHVIYVHPRVIKAWLESERPGLGAAAGLNRDESYTLRLIRPAT
jgi:DNA topoisomerase-1